MGLGVFVDPDGSVAASGGFLFQPLPGSDKEAVDRLIRQIERMPRITELLREGQPPEQVLEFVFADIPFNILERRPLAFRCSCSRERVERALISLGHSKQWMTHS